MAITSKFLFLLGLMVQAAARAVHAQAVAVSDVPPPPMLHVAHVQQVHEDRGEEPMDGDDIAVADDENRNDHDDNEEAESNSSEEEEESGDEEADGWDPDSDGDYQYRGDAGMTVSYTKHEEPYYDHHHHHHHRNRPKDRCAELKMRYGFNDDLMYRAQRQREWYPNGFAKTDPTCESASENPHGVYTANKASCIFEFHGIPNAEQIDVDLELSTECSSSNRLALGTKKKIYQWKDYVLDWGDECVADFQRCYSVQQHDSIIWKQFCFSNFTLPTGTTHVSVDCRKDKEAKNNFIEEQKKENRMHFPHFGGQSPNEGDDKTMEKMQLSNQNFWLSVLAMILLCCGLTCVVLMVFAQKCFFQPYLRAMKKSKSDNELHSLVEHDVEGNQTAARGRKRVEN